MGALNIYTLVWKNFKIQLRHPWRTAMEILIPIVLTIMLIIIRLTSSIENKEIETIFLSYIIDSLPPKYNTTNAWYLYYTPQTPFLEQVMEEVASYLNVTITGFPSEKDMVSVYQKSTLNIVGGITFLSNIKDGINFSGPISFKIRPESIPGISWNISQIAPDFNPGLIDRTQYGTYYRDFAFLAIQNTVSKVLLKTAVANLTQDFDDIFDIRMRRFPYPPYELDSFYKFIEYYLALAVGLGFLFPSIFIAKDVVRERQTKFKLISKLIGLCNWEIWMAWFIKSFIYLFILNLIMSAMLCIRFNGAAVFNHSYTCLIIILLMLYSVSIIAFSFFITTFFTTDNSAVAATGILYIITFLPYIHSRGLFHQLPLIAKLILCLLPNTLFSYSVRVIVRLELIGNGLRWETMSSTKSVNLELGMDIVFIMFLVDILLYFILTWYFGVMRPDPYQRKYPWYFPVMAAYWKGHFNVPSHSTKSVCHFKKSEFFQKDLSSVKPMINIQNLTKVYEGTSEPVINNINLKAYKSQITVLLGHHTSGKSTLTSMLYGAVIPTSGIIGIKQYNMCKYSDVRKIIPLLGICPHYDTSIDDLNIEENLYFFCRFKGFKTKAIQAEISHILNALDLEIRKNKLASSLPLNVRRRLSVGIALIGRPEVVILDEPTLHMDPDSRRIVWDALFQEKKGKAIFLTTSNIKEANTLADRLAVIHGGHLVCYGSPLFLKKKYGAGYQLTITKAKEYSSGIKNSVFSKIPDAVEMSDSEKEIKFMLPHDSHYLYPELFSELEAKTNEVVKMRIEETDLNNFFSRIISGNFEYDDINLSTSEMFRKSAVPLRSHYRFLRKRNEGCKLFCQHISAAFMKRFKFSIRNAFLTASQILVLPVIIIFTNLIKGGTFAYSQKISDAHSFTLDYFQGTYVTYGIDPRSNFTIDLGDTYADLFQSPETLYMVDLEEENYLEYLLEQAIKDFKLYETKYTIGAVFINYYSKILIIASYNADIYHSAPTSLLYVYNAILAYYIKDQSLFFDISNEPLPYREVEYNLLSTEYDLDLAFFWAQDSLIGMSILMSSYVVILVIENATKSKERQIISGLNAFMYWLSSFIYDFSIYVIPCILMLFTLSLFKAQCLSGGIEIGSLALLLFLHGLSALSFIYCCTFYSKSSSAAYIGVFLYYILGLLIVCGIFLLEVNNLYYISDILSIIFTVLMPSYCVGRGIYNIFKNCVGNRMCNSNYVQEMCLYKNSSSQIALSCCLDECGDFCFFWDENPLSLTRSGIGQQIIALAIHPFIFFILLLFLEMKLCRSEIKRKHLRTLAENYVNTDVSVLEEYKRIESTPLSQLIYYDHYLIIKEASKLINLNYSVGKLSFALKRGECFGLVGSERSGKSTLLKMIAGIIPLTSGNIYVDGTNIAVYPHKVQDKIGISFGNFALLEELTVKETLALYTHYRGIPKKEVPHFVEFFIRSLLLKPDVLVKYCNNTEKKKLDVAVTLLGTPPLILVDEPTVNMDPSAYIYTREVIRLAISLGCTAVIATQRIEEAENLCNRIGIMVKGKLNYIGYTKNLRKQFEDGYTLVVRFKKTYKSRSQLKRSFSLQGNLLEVKGCIEDTLPEAILKIEYPSHLNYYIPYKTFKWSKVFRLLEKMQFHELLSDYSIYRPNLEQIFYYLTFKSDLREKKITEFLKERKISMY